MKALPYYLLVLVAVLFLATVASSGTVVPPTEPCRLPSGGGSSTYGPSMVQ
jgi:hypothetical protein